MLPYEINFKNAKATFGILHLDTDENLVYATYLDKEYCIEMDSWLCDERYGLQRAGYTCGDPESSIVEYYDPIPLSELTNSQLAEILYIEIVANHHPTFSQILPKCLKYFFNKGTQENQYGLSLLRYDMVSFLVEYYDLTIKRLMVA